jgi:hypothetical protein
MIRKNVIIFHANLAKLTSEGRSIANKVVKPLVIKMRFDYKFLILIFNIQGHTCSPYLLHVAFKDFGCVGRTSKDLHMSMLELKTQHFDIQSIKL